MYVHRELGTFPICVLYMLCMFPGRFRLGFVSCRLVVFLATCALSLSAPGACSLAKLQRGDEGGIRRQVAEDLLNAVDSAVQVAGCVGEPHLCA